MKGVVMPRRHDEFDDDDRPRARKRSRHDDYEQDEGPRAGHRNKKRHKKKGSAIPIWAWIGGGVFLVAAITVTLVLILSGGKTPYTEQMDPYLMAHWTFDELKDDKIEDKSGKGNTVKLVSGRLDPGKRGKALFLEGRPDSYVDIDKSLPLNFAARSAFTFACWYQTSEKSGTIISFRSETENCQLDLVIRDRRVLCVVGDNDDDPKNGQHGFVWATVQNDGAWHHAAFTRSEDTLSLYVDGVFQGESKADHVGGKITTDMRAIGLEKMWLKKREQQWGSWSFWAESTMSTSIAGH